MKKFIWSFLAVILCQYLFAQNTINTIAGIPGVGGYSGDGGPATSATFSFPVKAASDAAGNIYIADNANNVIRKVSASGIVSTIAGNGNAAPGYAGDGGPALSAILNGPWGVVVHNGDVYFCDGSNHVIRKIDGNTGIISLVAGTPGVAGYSGDNGPAIAATLNTPTGIAADNAGNIYITDDNNNRVRKVDNAGNITTFAGTGVGGFSGDGGPADSAQIWFPVGISADVNGNVYLSDNVNHRIRKINTSGIINTVAGNGSPGYNGDGIAATSASLYNPWEAIADANGNIYIADFYNYCIRRVDGNTGIISTYAGSPTFSGYAGDNGPATSAIMNAPTGLCFDNNGNVVIVDAYNNIIRKIVPVVFQEDYASNIPIIGAGCDVSAFVGGTVRFQAETGDLSYLWQPSTGLSDSTVSDPFVTIYDTVVYILRMETSPGIFKYDTAVARSNQPSVTSQASCQNWVDNGDMEVGGCPLTYGQTPGSWFSAGGTCDLHATCAVGPEVSVPNNTFGIENSVAGPGKYAGLWIWEAGTNYAEYLQQQLPCALINGQTYALSFKASWGDATNYSCGDIGMLLTTTPINTGGFFFSASPQIFGAVGQNSWVNIGPSPFVGGGEQYITIGNFTNYPGNCTKHQNNVDPYATNNPPLDGTYNYVDDVKIVPVAPTIVANQTVVCTGLPSFITLSESGSPSGLCTWTGPNGWTATGSTVYPPTPNAAGTYIYTLTVNLGSQCPSLCGTLTNTVAIQVLQSQPGPPITIGTNSPICVDSYTGNTVASMTVTSGGPAPFVWASSNGFPNVIPNNSNWSQVAQQYNGPGTYPYLGPGVYTYSVSNSNCQGMGTATVVVNPQPSFTISPATYTYCAGQGTPNVTLTASDPNLTYTWSPAAGLSSTNGTSVVATPSVTTYYTAVGAVPSTGCSNVATATVAVVPPPVITTTVVNQNLCAGSTATINIGGAGIGGSYTILPSTPTPTYNINSLGTGAIYVQVNANTTYTITATTQSSSGNGGGCVSTKTVTINVTPLPTVTLTANPNPICPGESFTLTASHSPGLFTFQWSTGASTNSNTLAISPGPTVTTTYSVLVAQSNGCQNTATVSVGVDTPPFLAVSPTTTTVCVGSTVNFSTSVFPFSTTVAWTPTIGLNCGTCTNAPNPTGTYPSAGNFSYTVTATSSAGCTTKVNALVTVVPNPNLNPVANPATICSGTISVISVGSTNGSTYSITPSAVNQVTSGNGGSASFTVNPSVTTVYTVSSTNSNLCVGTKTVSVTVNPSPTITVNSPTICQGTSASLTATPTSGMSYSWTPFGSTSNPLNIPGLGVGTHTFVVNGTVTATGCKGNATGTITVQPSASVTITTSVATSTACNAPPGPTGNTICIGNSITLSANSPGATSYSWTPGGLTGSTIVVTPTASVVYTVTASGGPGFCPGKATQLVVVSNCLCNGLVLPSSGTPFVSTYAVNNNMTISGVLNLTNQNVLIAKGKSITVASTGTLTITNSHLHSCFDMWQGIIANPGATIILTNTAGNNNLIEDAVIPIDDNNNGTPNTSATTSTIRIQGTVFNCNRTSIRKGFYQNILTSNYNATKFVVRDAVFTCRCGITTTTTTGFLKTVVGVNPAPSITSYLQVGNLTSASLRSPYPNQPAYEGITFVEDGDKNSLLPSNTSYTVGAAGAANEVAFDNLVYGITALNANFYVTNSTFQLPKRLTFGTVGGYGIDAVNNSPAWRNGIYIERSRFVAMSRGVQAINYFDHEIVLNTFTSQQVASNPSGFGGFPNAPGEYGIFVKSPEFNQVHIRQNRLYNINNGIDMIVDASAAYVPTGNNQSFGSVVISSNILDNQFPNDNFATSYIGNGIIVDNVLLSPSGLPTFLQPPPVQISVSQNSIQHAYRGILARNHRYQEMRDELNNILLIPEPNDAFGNVTTQYGIKHDRVTYPLNAAAVGDDIHKNVIQGFTTTFANPNAFRPKKGIWCSLSGNHYVTCNDVTNTGRAIEFSGFNNNILWRLNRMASSGEGFVLSSNSGGGVIGQQGNVNDASDNRWFGFGVLNPQTVVELGSSSLSSVLWVQGLPTFNPTLHAGAGTQYQAGPSTSIQLTGPASTFSNCATQSPPSFVVDPENISATARGSQSNSIVRTVEIELLEKIALDSLPYLADSLENAFINKNELYRMIQQDTLLMDSSQVLRNFFNANQNSAYAKLSHIEEEIRMQNFSLAGILIASFNPSCGIELNYKRFFGIYLNGIQGTLNASDSSDLEVLANSCPRLNGAVVYQARAFHNSHYNSFRHYEDRCPEITPEIRSQAASQVKIQYSNLVIYPNPSAGKIYVSGFSVWSKHTHVEITDVTGKTVLSKENLISEGIMEIDMDLQDGVYFVRLIDDFGSTKIQKIIIQK